MKKFVLISILLIVFYKADAQYKHGLGLAFGSPSGISYKTFLNENKALDFTFGGFRRYFILTAMYEIHNPWMGDLKWYYGPGAHIGSWSRGWYGEGAFIGIDGAVGLEFQPNIPFVFSLDLRPGINLLGNRWDDSYHWFWWQSQLAVRYTF